MATTASPLVENSSVDGKVMASQPLSDLILKELVNDRKHQKDKLFKRSASIFVASTVFAGWMLPRAPGIVMQTEKFLLRDLQLGSVLKNPMIKNLFLQNAEMTRCACAIGLVVFPLAICMGLHLLKNQKIKKTYQEERVRLCKQNCAARQEQARQDQQPLML